MGEDIFAKMFGDIVSPKPKEDRTETDHETPEETVIEVDSSKTKSVPFDGNGKAVEIYKDDDADGCAEDPEAEAERIETEEKTEAEPPAGKTEDGKDSELPTKDELNEAKKELGIGGAAFVDELLTKVPDAFSRLREAGKTLHGLFNFAYSLALKEYTAAHGRVNGGGWWDTETMLARYLDPSVKEGFVYGEPKTRKYEPPTPAQTVEAVAKEAAKDAKKSEAKAKRKASRKSAKKKSEPEVPARRPSDGIQISKFDFSKLIGGR